MKESYYFGHDYNARTDPKLQAVLMEMGLAGIGMFWCVVEQLYEQDGYLKMSALKSIAFSMHAEADDVERLIKEFGLFENDGEKFWSPSVCRRLSERKELSGKRRAAVNKRWKESKKDEMPSNNTPVSAEAERIAESERKQREREEIRSKAISREEYERIRTN